MRASRRVLNLLQGIGSVFLIVVVIVLWAIIPELAPQMIALILGVSMIVFGIRSLIQYVTTFRHMIQGETMLYSGIIALDLGLLLMHAYNGSTILILIYLLGLRLFTGGIDAARALQAKKMGGRWKIQLLSGAVNVAIAVVGIVFIRNPNTIIYIYCLGLAFSAAGKFVAVFKKTAFEYIA